MRKPCGANLEWIGSFLAIFLPKCREAFEDMKERWNDPCMENGDISVPEEFASVSPARPGWTSEADPSAYWREVSCRPSVCFPEGGAECLLRRQRMSRLSL